VGFVTNNEIEFYAGQLGRSRQSVTALIGGKDNIDFGWLAQPRSDFLRLSVRGQTGIINLADKFVALKVANGFVAAYADPAWHLALSEEFTRPIGNALPNQAEAWNRDDDGSCLDRFGDPKRD
jgi:hypothetical protein